MLYTALRTGSFLLLSVAWAACGGGGGGGSSDPCDRLLIQCDECTNRQAQAQCYNAVTLGSDSTCQQLLNSGTYESLGVECSR